MKHPFLRPASALILGFLAAACTSPPSATATAPRDTSFTIAVVPDTQNYVDYTHQTEAGFPFDAREMLFAQMRWIAEHVESAGGDIAFVTQLGDVWQHFSKPIDPEHEARGMQRAENPALDWILRPTPKTREVEMPTARRAFEILAGKVPFSVLPGNHDADAMWTDARFPPAANADLANHATIGLLHAGGWDGFREVFGSDSSFFAGQPWYVGGHDGGADSAQVFEAGGYRFLHIALRFDPPDSALAWAASVIAQHPGLPTIVATHHYLDGEGGRSPLTDSHALDPQDNNPEMVWQKLISQHDQIFLVLCGHVACPARRTDKNRFGHEVHQVLSDYQSRGRTALEAGAKEPIGDGWMRLMRFDMAAPVPTIEVKTWSTHYRKLSSELPDYAAWYRAHEQPEMTDAEFLAADEFVIELKDFRTRFDQTP